MRAPSPAATASFAALAALTACGALAASCAGSPALSVERGAVGQTFELESGTSLKLRKLDGNVSPAKGYHVARSEAEWAELFRDETTPPVPGDVSLANGMVFVVVPESPEVDAARVDRVIDTFGGLHVYVTETLRGPGCSKSAEERPVALAATRKVVKPLRVHVRVEQGEGCGDPPLPVLVCGPRDRRPLAPGGEVACVGSSETRGKFAVVDRALGLERAPAGSTTKLSFAKGPLEPTFVTDLFGAYVVRLEVTDEAGRRAHADATVDVLPPPGDFVWIEQHWQGFDATDDPSTFPRLTVNALDVPDGKPRRDCAVARPGDKPDDVCQVTPSGARALVRLPATDRRYRVKVTYRDERFEKAPRVCLRAFRAGAKTFEQCDLLARKDGDAWESEVLDGRTGAPPAPPPPPPLDAGASDASPAHP